MRQNSPRRTRAATTARRSAVVGAALLVTMLSLLSQRASAQADPGMRAVALVTGSTDGLGREVALRLGGAGYHVIVHGRNEERGRAVGVVDGARLDEREGAIAKRRTALQ